MVGPSRIGKTEWARSLGRHMYFNGLFDLKQWDPEAEYIIFDDFDFDYVPQLKAFWGGQKMFALTDKYRAKKTVKFGKAVIYLCNPDQDPVLSKKWCDFFVVNSVRVDLFNKLY